jgi:bromodomain and PHD finger-containing protein 1
MVLSFDLRDFLSNCKASKPPYRCPVETCGKTYRSFAGIQQHVQQSHSDESGKSKRPVFSSNPNPMFYNDDSSDGNTGTTHQLFGTRENLTYAEAQRMIEVEIDGRIHRINIAEPMGIVCLEQGPTDAIESTVSNHQSCLSDQANRTEAQSDDGDGDNCTSGRRSVKKGRHRRRESGKSSNHSIGNKKSVPTGQNLQSVVSEPINAIVKLPEPSFRLLTDRQVCRAPPRPLAYFRYIDKSPEELDEQVEYDMDEEDFSWLELINKKRKKDNLAIIPPDTFELLMDRLEKECYFMNEKNGNGDYYSNQAIDEDAVCCICNDGKQTIFIFRKLNGVMVF